MIIDHIGAVFSPQQLWFRALGRLSFPIFAYLVADGVCRTHHQKRFLGRLGLFALVSQLPYMLAFRMDFTQPLIWNIFVTLGLGAILCLLYREKKWYGIVGLLILLLFNQLGLQYDYGLYGVLVVFTCFIIRNIQIFHEPICNAPYWEKNLLIIGFLFLTLLYCFRTFAFIQMFAVFAAFLLPMKEKKENGWGVIGYWIYPIHLLLFWVISSFI